MCAIEIRKQRWLGTQEGKLGRYWKMEDSAASWTIQARRQLDAVSHESVTGGEDNRRQAKGKRVTQASTITYKELNGGRRVGDGESSP